jgi:hypothetical protein
MLSGNGVDQRAAPVPPGPISPFRGSYASIPAAMLRPPTEGNRTIPISVSWLRDGQSPSYTVEFNARLQQVLNFSQICAVHVDNTRCSSAINIVFPDTNFQIVLGPNTEGFYPVLTNGLSFVAYIDLTPTANDVSIIQVMNFLPPPIEFGSNIVAGAGTVRQINTVAPIQGGPITDTGSISLSTPLTINFGGTNAATAGGALDSLSGASGATAGSLSRSSGGVWSVTAAGAGTITGVTAGNGLTGGGVSGAVTLGLVAPVSIANGGTGAITAPAALAALGGAPLNNAGLTGSPTAPTAAPGTNTTQLATTQYVQAALAGVPPGTVTSVAAGAGLTASPSPITGAGTLSLASPVAVVNGGTGKSVAPIEITGAPTPSGSFTTTAATMLGLNITFTPASTGKMLVIICGNVQMNGASGGSTVITLRAAAGTPPAFAAAAVGAVLATNAFSASVNGQFVPFCLVGFITLGVGATAWLDVAGNANGGATVLPGTIQYTAIELPI